MTGATCCFAGMAQRLTKELVQLAPVGTDVVIANNDSANHAAAGTGSNSAALSADEKAVPITRNPHRRHSFLRISFFLLFDTCIIPNL